jgi:hypothetical protein
MGRGTIANAHEIERMSRFPVLATVPLDLLRVDRKTEQVGEPVPVFVGMASAQSSGNEQVFGSTLMRSRKESRAL